MKKEEIAQFVLLLVYEIKKDVAAGCKIFIVFIISLFARLNKIIFFSLSRSFILIMMHSKRRKKSLLDIFVGFSFMLLIKFN